MRHKTFGNTAADFAFLKYAWLRGGSIDQWQTTSDWANASAYPAWLAGGPTYGEIPITTLPPGSASSAGDIALLVSQYDFSALRSLIGNAPVIVRANMPIVVNADWGNGVTGTLAVARMDRSKMANADMADMNFRYKDLSALTPWDGDLNGPHLGVEVYGGVGSTQIPWAALLSTGVGLTGNWAYNQILDMTAMVREGLLSGLPIYAMWYAMQTGALRTLKLGWYTGPINCAPYFDILYFLPIESFNAKADGTIDLASPLDAYVGDDSRRINLGTIERLTSGLPVKMFLRNLSTQTFKLLRIGDDVPEAATPVKIAGAGTGTLHYVSLAEAAVSQVWYFKFTSPTAFQVKALRWRDNAADLHNVYGGTGWEGDISAQWDAPTGGLSVPSAAWQQAGNVAGDEWEVAVLGNTTDTSWPADSNDQVAMTEDSSGSPDDAAYRPIQGYSAKSAASVTVDATTKEIPVRPIVAAQWPTGTQAWIGDGTPKLQRGTISAVQEASVGADAFTGTGLDDFSVVGGYRGTVDRTYRVQIDGTGTPDTFKWSKDGGSTWAATTVAVNSSWIHLEEGICVKWAATTGHTSGDYWDVAVLAASITLAGLTANSDVFAAGSWVSTTLPWSNAAPSVWLQATAAFGVSSVTPRRIMLTGPAAAGFSTSDAVFVQDLDDDTINCERVIATVGSNYIDVTADFDHDFVSGSLCLKKGSGEHAIWLKATATGATVEQRKDFRINTRA
jgi:hypothetical protein